MSQQDMDRPGCLAGCDRSPRDPAAQPTPGQLLHSLHSMSREDQLDAAQRMLEASDTAVRCFTRDHDGRLARDDDERLVLLWLHAEAAWKVEHLSDWRDIDRMSLEQLLDERDCAEASRRDWAAEAGYLRRELEFELCGINVDMEDFFLNVGDRVEFTRPDGVIARGEVVDLDPVRVMADDTGNTTRWPTDLRKARPCSCLTPEGAAVVVAGGFSLPRCAVHPEADR